VKCQLPGGECARLEGCRSRCGVPLMLVYETLEKKPTPNRQALSANADSMEENWLAKRTESALAHRIGEIGI